MINPNVSKCSNIFRKKVNCLKMIGLFLFLGIHPGYANKTYSQSTHISLDIENKTIQEVFEEIEKSTEYIFFYYDDVLDVNRKVNIREEDKTIDIILDKLFESSENDYYINDRQIFITAKEKKEQPIPQSHQQQTRKITGIIKDSYDDPLIGASVMIEGTSTGTVTGIDGDFSLDVPEGATLIISYIGYHTQKLRITNQTSLNIVMQENLVGLEEVVIIGYGVQKKANLTGSVASVSGDEIASKSSSDVLSALQGEMPGVAVLRSSGQPGSETSGIRIRGFSSVNETSALVLIDGVEGDMTLLNPQDIESISVLKDAAASAIYGARAAAGVILVTTKSGMEGKTRISYNGYFGVNTPTHMPKRLPAWEEQEFINESRRQASGSPEWNDEQSSWVGNPNFNYRPNNTNGRWDLFDKTDWVSEGTRNATTQHSHSVSVSGGTKGLNYLVSGGYYSKNGLLKYGPDKNERYNLRFKMNAELNKYMTLGINTSYNGKFMDTNSYGATGILNSLYTVRARQPIYLPEEDETGQIYNGDLQINPIQIMKEGGKDSRQTEEFVGRAELTIKDLLPGFRLQLNASRQAGYYHRNITKRTLIWYDRLGSSIRQQVNNPNSLEKRKNYSYHDNLEALAYYDLNVNKHSLNILAGTTYERYRKDEMITTVKSLNSNDFFSFNTYDSSETTNTVVSDEIETWAMMSYFGRVNYNYAERYLFEANIRYDGSSRLAPGNRWKAFPSFSLGWRVSEEEWFNVPLITNLKARVSWGQLGIGSIVGLYDYLALLEDGNLMGDKYYYQDRMVSTNKSWEVVQTTNIGLDASLLDSRLNLTADYYWKYNNDMLSEYNLPNLVGVKAPYGNIGKLKTWGWDIEVGWQDRIGKVDYRVGFNLSDSDNKLVEYNGTNVIKAGSVKLLEGYSLNTLWGYQTDGFWSSREEYLAYKEAHPGYESFNDANVSGGDIKYVAQGNADHTIGAGGGTPDDPGDLIYLGNSNGRYLYGLNLSLQWNNFDISMLWQGVAKRKLLINTSTIAPLAETYQMPWTIHRDYWTEENQDAYWPRLYSANSFNYHPSDRWVQNAAYIRLKNIQIGYNVPLKKGIIEKLRVYVSGDDIWEHTKLLKVFDPEVGNEISYNYYPFFRTWSVGLNITF